MSKHKPTEAELTAKAAHDCLIGIHKEKAGAKAPPKKAKATKAKAPTKKPAKPKKPTKTGKPKPNKAKGTKATKAKAEKREAEVSKIKGGLKGLNADPRFEVTFKSGNRWRTAGFYETLEAGMERFSRLKRSLYRGETVCIQNLDTHRAVSSCGILTTSAEDNKTKEDLPPGKVEFRESHTTSKALTKYKKGTKDHPSVDELFGADYRETETEYKGADSD